MALCVICSWDRSIGISLQIMAFCGYLVCIAPFYSQSHALPLWLGSALSNGPSEGLILYSYAIYLQTECVQPIHWEIAFMLDDMCAFPLKQKIKIS